MAGKYVAVELSEEVLAIIAENPDLEANIRKEIAESPGDDLTLARRIVADAAAAKARAIKASEARVKVICKNIWLGDGDELQKYYRMNTVVIPKKLAQQLEAEERVVIIS